MTVEQSLRRLQTARLSPGRGDQPSRVTSCSPFWMPSASSDCFALLAGGNCVPVKKPSPESAAARLPRAGVSPSRTPDGGDSENDVLAAQAGRHEGGGAHLRLQPWPSHRGFPALTGYASSLQQARCPAGLNNKDQHIHG